jgi:putative phage-type endonuclease
MSPPHQETLSVDGLIDRMLKRSREPAEISNIINEVFTPIHLIDVNYVNQRVNIVENYVAQLEKLKLLPQVEQRTPEWYAMRKTLITASDFAQALGDAKFGTQRQLYIKKSGYEEDKFNGNSPPLKWGVMFESVACDIYSRRYGVVVNEFGLLRHPTIAFFGASPDGITDQGVMLEIKCPFKRKITGEIPLQYYYQIQGQLEVCGLDECDYLECEFELYSGEQTFFEDHGMYEKGVIVEYAEDKDNLDTVKYKYGPTIMGHVDKDQVDTWMSTQVNEIESAGHVVVSWQFWKLSILNSVRVYRNQNFIDDKIAQLAIVWDKILAYQKDKDLYMSEIGTIGGRKTPQKVVESPKTVVVSGHKIDFKGNVKIEDYAFLDDEE